VDAAFLDEIEGWREALAKDIARNNEELSQPALNWSVQQTIDRIIFLRIAEDRGIEPYGQLQAVQNGHNHAIYRNTADGMFMRVGFPVKAQFASTDEVECLAFSPGKAAHITHRGEYSGIPGAYEKLHAWREEQKLKLTGLSWEVYGDWSDDPAKVRTEIYLQLA